MHSKEGDKIMRYYYFISFTGRNNMGQINGNMTHDRNSKLKTMTEIRELQKDIEDKNNLNNVTIMNIVLLDKAL